MTGCHTLTIQHPPYPPTIPPCCDRPCPVSPVDDDADGPALQEPPHRRVHKRRRPVLLLNSQVNRRPTNQPRGRENSLQLHVDLTSPGYFSSLPFSHRHSHNSFSHLGSDCRSRGMLNASPGASISSIPATALRASDTLRPARSPWGRRLGDLRQVANQCTVEIQQATGFNLQPSSCRSGSICFVILSFPFKPTC